MLLVKPDKQHNLFYFFIKYNINIIICYEKIKTLLILRWYRWNCYNHEVKAYMKLNTNCKYNFTNGFVLSRNARRLLTRWKTTSSDMVRRSLQRARAIRIIIIAKYFRVCVYIYYMNLHYCSIKKHCTNVKITHSRIN